MNLHKLTLVVAATAMLSACGGSPTTIAHENAWLKASQSIMPSSDKALLDFQNALLESLQNQTVVLDFSDTYSEASNSTILSLFISDGRTLRITATHGRTLGDDQFSDFRITQGTPTISPPQRNSCLKEKLTDRAGSQKITWVGILFTESNLSFGYSEGQSFGYDLSTDQCSGYKNFNGLFPWAVP